jgi:hypothetical protein
LWRYILEDQQIIVQRRQEPALLFSAHSKGLTLEGSMEPYCFINLRPIGHITRLHGQYSKLSEGVDRFLGEISYDLVGQNTFDRYHYEPLSLTFDDIEVKPAFTKDEFDTYLQLMRAHKFGAAKHYIALISQSRGRVVGAAALDIDHPTRFSEASLGRYHIDLSPLQRYLILIRRMATRSHIVSKWKNYRILFRAVCEMAPAFTDEEIIIVGGHTHDPNPAATKEGFRVEIPKSANRALFYWKPVKGFRPTRQSFYKRNNELRKYVVNKIRRKHADKPAS